VKRNVHLQPLSRQHHNGLLAGLLVTKGLKKDAGNQVLADFILHVWRTDLQPHFLQEETVLIPALQNTAFNAGLTQQLLNEHRQIRNIIEQLEQGRYSREQLGAFASLLEQHIRFEERSYFPEAEKILTEEQLQYIGAHLHEEAGDNCMNYPVKFW
jgi:hemerythrin-like domain-containing protein